MIQIAELRRTYAQRKAEPRVALDGISLDIGEGEVHGLLGPNGAGKTTLCKILATLLVPTSGSAQIDGKNVVTEIAAIRRIIGMVFGGDRGLYTRLTARENLMYWSALYFQRTADARKRTSALLDRVGLSDRADERVETYSRGMKQRLHLARGLIGDPRVLLLDEPTVGLDPVAARDFRVLVDELRSEGRTVLLTTHDMAEAESVCDRVSLIDQGRLITTESPKTIGRWLTSFERVTASAVAEAVVVRLSELSGVETVNYEAGDRTISVETSAPGAASAVVLELAQAGALEITTSRPSLSDVYLHLVGGKGLKVG